MKLPISLCMALCLATTGIVAQTVQLRSGAVLVGDVDITDGGTKILVHVRYPKVEDRLVNRDEVTPRSLYAIFERRADRKSAESVWTIAMLAKEARMYGNAISDLRAFKKLAPKKAHAADTAIKEVRELLAESLLQGARQSLATENPRAALVYIHTIKEQYPETKAARETSKLMSVAHARAGKRVDIAIKTVSEKAAPKVLAKIAKYRGKGDHALEHTNNRNRALIRGSKRRLALDRAIAQYRKAWEAAKTLPVAVESPELQAQIRLTKKVARKLLVGALIEAATLQLSRTSVTKAESYCNEACALDPDNPRLRDVHKTILEAKAYGY